MTVQVDTSTPSLVIKDVTVIDGTGAAPFVADVVVRGGRIESIGNDLDASSTIDGRDGFLLPGLIDSHIHSIVDSFDLLQIIESPFSMEFFRAQRNLEKTLRAGVTTARDLGGADLGIRHATEVGMIDGPDLQIAVNIMSVTGGHGDHWSVCGFEVPDMLPHPGRPAAVCDGKEQATRVARELLRAGADFLKVCTTGGLLSPRDDPFSTQFLPEELDAIVRVADDAGVPVVAHAQSPRGIQRAIQAGIRTIEHGFYLDETTVQMMVDHDVFLVPTMMAPHGVIDMQAGRRASEVEQARRVIDAHRDSVALAVQAGVKIAMGTDAGAIPHGDNRKELLLMSQAGMTPLEAIRAATAVSAQNLGVHLDRGTIEPGKRADLILTDVNPIADLETFCGDKAQLSVWKEGRHVTANLPRG